MQTGQALLQNLWVRVCVFVCLYMDRNVYSIHISVKDAVKDIQVPLCYIYTWRVQVADDHHRHTKWNR